MTTKVARIFRNGRSEAVRIPKAWSLHCREVEIARVGEGLLIRRRPQTVADLAALDGLAPALRLVRPRRDHPRKLAW